MKKLSIIAGVAIITFILPVLAACSSNQTEINKLKADNAALTKQNDALKELAGPPPSSLDQFFPPAAPAPVYLIEMFTLAGPFGGIGVDLQEQDIPGVKANYQAFKAQYDKVAGMVPEWKDRFPQDPVTALGKAIDSGNPAQIGPAMGQVGQVCGTCHSLYQVKVQQKYHWKNFDDIKVTDPVTKKELNWPDYMTAMTGSYEGTFTDLQEGQMDKSQQNYTAFSAQFKALAQDGCKQCHQDPTGKEIARKYFVDADSMALVDQLGKALSANPPDATAIGNLSGAIGNNSCLNCHLVHLPAQNTKDNWEQFQDILK